MCLVFVRSPWAPLEVDGHEDLLFVAAADVQHFVPVDRCCHNVGRHARALPQYVARFQIVSANAVGTANDNLRPVNSLAVLANNDDRRTPGGIFLAVPAPQVLASSFVQNHQ